MDTTLIFSVLVAMFFFPRNPFEPSWLVVAYGSLGILFRRMRAHWIFWLGFVIYMSVTLVLDYLHYSRTFLIAYWSLAVMLALQKKNPLEQSQLMATNAQYLLAFGMLFAALNKVLSPDFLDGRFFSGWMLLTPTNMDLMNAIFTIPKEDLLANQKLVQNILTNDAAHGLTLATAGNDFARVYTVSHWFSWCGTVIEFLIGVLFLLPRKPHLATLRLALLIAFLLTCYVVVPVFTFAAILIVLGYAQCREEDLWLKRFFCAVVPMVALYTVLPKINGWSTLRNLISQVLP